MSQCSPCWWALLCSASFLPLIVRPIPTAISWNQQGEETKRKKKKRKLPGECALFLGNVLPQCLGLFACVCYCVLLYVYVCMCVSLRPRDPLHSGPELSLKKKDEERNPLHAHALGIHDLLVAPDPITHSPGKKRHPAITGRARAKILRLKSGRSGEPWEKDWDQLQVYSDIDCNVRMTFKMNSFIRARCFLPILEHKH